LTPLDAFELLDENHTGYLDEDEYNYALDYLQVEATDEVREDLFMKFDYNLTGTIGKFLYLAINTNIDICFDK